MREHVQLSRRKGWRLPLGVVNVARPGKWGNPFRVGTYGTAAQCVLAFQAMLGGCLAIYPGAPSFAAQRAYRDMFLRDWRELQGKRLACWCRPGQLCHADALAEAVVLLGRARKCRAR